MSVHLHVCVCVCVCVCVRACDLPFSALAAAVAITTTDLVSKSVAVETEVRWTRLPSLRSLRSEWIHQVRHTELQSTWVVV